MLPSQLQVAGSVEIDLAEYFGQNNVEKTFIIENPNIVKSAEIHAKISVVELSKEEAEKAMEGQVTGSTKFEAKIDRFVEGTGEFLKSDEFAAIAELTGDEDLKNISETA